MLIKRIVVGALETNCYLLSCKQSQETVIIDPGAESKRIVKEITDLKLKPKMIILTHGHGDHITAVNDLKEYYQIPLYVHKEEEKILLNSENSFVHLLTGKDINFTIDKYLEDGEIIKLGSLIIKIIHTPGHTSGGISLNCNNVIFTGDTLFKGSIGRTDLPGGSLQEILNSIKTKLLTYPDETIIYPGHGSSSTIGKEKESNLFLGI
ncbi:MAG: MBL fold metallo-hydrolase [Bacilli bacterium]|jgi:hydroxyacylglutathione hydrolase